MLEVVFSDSVLGKYQLGIGDIWVASRIDAMVANGELEIAEPSEDGSYRRKLRKPQICQDQEDDP